MYQAFVLELAGESVHRVPPPKGFEPRNGNLFRHKRRGSSVIYFNFSNNSVGVYTGIIEF